MLKHINEQRGNYIKFLKAKKLGLPTGFPTLDNMIFGLCPGYHILAARPSVGKTSCALNMAVNIAKEGNNVLFFSLEMNENSFLERIVAMITKATPSEIRTDCIPKKSVPLVESIDKTLGMLPLYVDYKSHHTPSTIANQINFLKAQRNFSPAIVFIDYIQYMKTNNNGHPTSPANLAEISRDLVQISKDLGIPFVVICQLNRGADEYKTVADQKEWKPKTPRLMDLKGSGALEEDTDTVLLLHRTDYYKEREDEEYDASAAPLQNAKIVIAKNRQGPCGSFKLSWIPEIFQFSEEKIDEGENYEYE